MKPIWTQTLAWLAAVVAALLFALASPDLSLLLQGEVLAPGTAR